MILQILSNIQSIGYPFGLHFYLYISNSYYKSKKKKNFTLNNRNSQPLNALKNIILISLVDWYFLNKSGVQTFNPDSEKYFLYTLFWKYRNIYKCLTIHIFSKSFTSSIRKPRKKILAGLLRYQHYYIENLDLYNHWTL